MTTRAIPATLVATMLLLAAPTAEAQQPPPTPPTTQPTTQQPQQQGRQPARRRGDRSRLTRADLDEAGITIATARDAIRILRPHWLQPPSGRMASSNVADAGGGATVVVLYIDGTRQIDHEPLLMLRNEDLVEMRYLDQNRAIAIHGPGHEAGVIEVTTTAKRKP